MIGLSMTHRAFNSKAAQSCFRVITGEAPGGFTGAVAAA